MKGPIEERYFNWLCAKVLTPTVPIYFGLMQILHKTEFVWVVNGDKNRGEDVLELREDFLRVTFTKKDPEWFNTPFSVFEVLIAFAQRAAFQTDMPVRDWFWIFMTNLGLDEYRQVSRSDHEVIVDILETFLWRTYDENGYGGLFPLRWPKQDQREVEIAYQFFAYLDEQGMM